MKKKVSIFIFIVIACISLIIPIWEMDIIYDSKPIQANTYTGGTSEYTAFYIVPYASERIRSLGEYLIKKGSSIDKHLEIDKITLKLPNNSYTDLRKGIDEAPVISEYVARKITKIDTDGFKIIPAYVRFCVDSRVQPGDQVTAVNNISVNSAKEFYDITKNGKSFDISFKRQNKVFTIPLEKGGTLDVIDMVIPGPKIKIKEIPTGNFGDSLGLMLTLQRVQELTNKDFTNKRKIAGTGAIHTDGTIGEIDGIKHKIYSADKEGMDIFLFPKGGNNEKEALKIAKELKTKMKMVPVSTASEAIDYITKNKE